MGAATYARGVAPGRRAGWSLWTHSLMEPHKWMAIRLEPCFKTLPRDRKAPIVQAIAQILPQISDPEPRGRLGAEAPACPPAAQPHQADLQPGRPAERVPGMRSGACKCWGAHAACDVCKGKGAPGFFEPVPASFEAIVALLLRARPDLCASDLRGERASKPTEA